MSLFGLWLRLLWEPRDLWVGVYVKAPYWEMGRRVYTVYLCLVPCVPLMVSWRRKGRAR
jgi:hypothetical protein